LKYCRKCLDEDDKNCLATQEAEDEDAAEKSSDNNPEKLITDDEEGYTNNDDKEDNEVTLSKDANDDSHWGFAFCTNYKSGHHESRRHPGA